MIKLGIDVHNVADKAPHFFSELSKVLVKNGHEVHILTGAEKTDALIAYVSGTLKLHFTHFFSITSWHRETGAKIIYIDGNPYMENQSWNRAKADYCKKHGIHLHIDDSDIYGKYFTTPYARFIGNTPVLMPAGKKSSGGKTLLDDLSNYDDSDYIKPSVTVDIAVCTLHLNVVKILLIKRKYPPFRNHWALPGGFLEVEKNETLADTARRELEEETGLTGIPVRQLGTYGDPGRDPRSRTITTVFYAFIASAILDSKPIQSADDAADAQWFSLKNMAFGKSDLAFDHGIILSDLYAALQKEITRTPLAFELAPAAFHLEDIQLIYETILDQPIDIGLLKTRLMQNYRLEKSPGSNDRFVYKGEKKLCQ